MLQLHGLGYQFPDNHVRALKGVDLVLEPGKIHALLGENGAGKSTLARICTGHVSRWEGRMELEGKPYLPVSPRHAISRGVALVPQHPRLDTTQSVGKNLFMGHSNYRRFVYSGNLRRELEAKLASWGMDLDLSAPGATLDAPAMHWLALAEALLTDPHWLFLDEPSASYPETEVEQLYRLLARLASQGMGVVVITHRLKEVEKYSRIFHVLRQGRLVASRITGELEKDESIFSLLFPSGTPATGTAAPISKSQGKTSFMQKNTGQGLVVRGLTIKTGHGRRLDLGFRVAPGTVMGILGHWDQGLEDLEDLLGGMNTDQSDKIEFDGLPLTKLAPDRRGYIPSRRFQRGIAVGLSMKDNLLIRCRRDRKLAGSKQALALLRSQIPLAEDRDWNDAIETLSGGMIQKLIIHRETALPEPDFLICAEPWWGLDFQAQADMKKLLEQHRTGREVVLILSSDIDEIMALADQAAVLHPEGLEKPVAVRDTDRAWWEGRLFRCAEARRA